jgi:hypothetical protein
VPEQQRDDAELVEITQHSCIEGSEIFVGHGVQVAIEAVDLPRGRSLFDGVTDKRRKFAGDISAGSIVNARRGATCVRGDPGCPPGKWFQPFVKCKQDAYSRALRPRL